MEKKRNLHVVRGNAVEGLLRFYKDHNHFNADVQVHDKPISSLPAVAETLLDFNDTTPLSAVECVDQAQARVGTDNDLSLGDEEVFKRRCFKYYITLSSRRFVENEAVLLVVIDRQSTQRMVAQISLTCQSYPDLFRGYEVISHKQLSRELRENELRHLEHQRCCLEAIAYQTMFRQPALFVALTPNIANSFELAQYTGVTSAGNTLCEVNSFCPMPHLTSRASC
ncbi:hypothetical protein PHMEG_00019156 [Phytophthora megakarya]|uniref:Uncharacterized protein n=1 Tax=Phytophthora megakarya TaxID=4795 RepID=A0A225VS87_9STRA|nr:hypothetical protein PHMEG_00019156 [Phytophthora megakarya]